MARYVNKEYLFEQFKSYDRLVAEDRYAKKTDLNTKQNVLTPGTGITIVNNVISATGSSGGGGGASTSYTDQIPIMTNNLQPSGQASASSIAGANYDAYKAFNDSQSDIQTLENGWLAATTDNTPWLMYKFESAVQFDKLTIITANNSTAQTKTFYIEGSNDGTSFTNVLKTGSTYDLYFADGDYTNYYILLNGSTYQYLRIRTTSALNVTNQYACGISKMQLQTGQLGVLDELSDVEITNPTDKQVLKYDGTQNKWINDIDASGISELEQLDDVNISSPSNNQILKYNASQQKWINGTNSINNIRVNDSTIIPDATGTIDLSIPENLNDIDNVYINQPTDNQVLQYNSTTQKWENGDGSESIINSNNTVISFLDNDHALIYDEDSEKWYNRRVPLCENSMIPSNGECLIYDDNNHQWKPGYPTLSDLSDVSYNSFYSIPQGALLAYDDDSNIWKVNYLAYNTADSKGGRNYLKNIRIKRIFDYDSGTITDAKIINGELHVTGTGGYIIVDFDAAPGEYILSTGVNLITIPGTEHNPIVDSSDDSWNGSIDEDDTLGLNGNEKKVIIFSGYSHEMRFLFYNGTYTNVVFKPMLRLPNDIDSNYESPINEMKIYSTDERKIGYWIDGSSLYAITIEFNYTGTDNLYTIDTNILTSNLSRIWIHDGFFYNSTHVGSEQLNINSGTYYVNTSVSATGNTAIINVSRNLNTMWEKGCVTLYYIRTTS